MIYNTNYTLLQYCDGASWIAMHPPGSGSGGCSNPARPEGAIIYNPPYRTMQGCAGNVWKAMGPLGATTCTAPPEMWTAPGKIPVTVPAGCNVAQVEAWGAGGGGGFSHATTTLNAAGGGGGGSAVERANNGTVLTAAGGGGGAGGGTTTGTNFGGGGGAYAVSNSVAVTEKETLNIYVGGGGASGCSGNINGAGGAYNGSAGVNNATPAASIFGGGGGNSGTGNGGGSTYGGGGGDTGSGTGGSSSGGGGAGGNSGAVGSSGTGGVGDTINNGANGSGSTGGAGAIAGGYQAGSGANGNTCGSKGGDGRVRIVWSRADLSNCAGYPPGTVCGDGTVYAGLSPDGNVPMFTTPCDYDGPAPSCGARVELPWNNGNGSGYTATGAVSTTDGDGNTATIVAVDSNSGAGGTQPHQAAQACADLVYGGHGDWYLPATDEMAVLKSNRIAIGNFWPNGPWPIDFYWGSNEMSGTQARGYRFNPSDALDFENKQFSRKLRCVRQAAFVSKQPSSGGDITSNLIASWQMEDGPGSSIVSDSAGSYTGTLTNMNPNTDWVTGKVGGYALDFDGSNQSVEIGDIPAIDGVQKVTLTAWMKRAVNGDLAVGKWLAGDTDDILIHETNSGGGVIWFELGNGGDNAASYDGVNDAQWHHVALVFDGTQTGNSGRLKAYLDGKFISLDYGGSTIPATTTSNTTPFRIARWDTNYGTGQVDDVRLYTRALSAADILALYSLGAAGGCGGWSEGTMTYNTAGNVMQYCDGANWVGIGK